MDAGRDEEVRAYSEFELELLHHAITVADQKASFVLGLAVAFAAAAFEPTILAVKAHAEPRALLGAVGEFCIIASAIGAFLAVVPRIISGTPTSDTYWGSTIFRGPVEAYVRRVGEITSAELSSAMLRHLHVLGRICRKKYVRLRLAFYTAPVGVLLLALSYAVGPTY